MLALRHAPNPKDVLLIPINTNEDSFVFQIYIEADLPNLELVKGKELRKIDKNGGVA